MLADSVFLEENEDFEQQWEQGELWQCTFAVLRTDYLPRFAGSLHRCVASAAPFGFADMAQGRRRSGTDGVSMPVSRFPLFQHSGQDLLFIIV
jgi:hypothetical protein